MLRCPGTIQNSYVLAYFTQLITADFLNKLLSFSNRYIFQFHLNIGTMHLGKFLEGKGAMQIKWRKLCSSYTSHLQKFGTRLLLL